MRTTTRGTSVFGGDLVTSGSIYVSRTIQSLENSNSYLEFEYPGGGVGSFKLVGGGTPILTRDVSGTPTSIVINSDGAGISTLIKTNAKYAIASKHTTNTVYINSDNASEDGVDTCFWVSGSIGSKNTTTRGTSVFGGDVVISGSLTARQTIVTHHAVNLAGTTVEYIPFNGTLSEGAPAFNAQMVKAHGGILKAVVVRAASAAGSTVVGFHRETGTGATVGNVATETRTIDMSATGTPYTFVFSSSTYSSGNLVGISINPSSAPNGTNIMCIWEDETY